MPCTARARNSKPKLVLKAKAKRKTNTFILFNNQFLLKVDINIITNPVNIGML
jgi:hypothetical protein